MSLDFAITYDYRCPFARNLCTLALDGLEAGADWDLRFVPFSLGQAHITEGEPDVWDDPSTDTGLMALSAGVAVRTNHPESFLSVHRSLFEARHDEGRRIKDPEVVRSVLADCGLDPDEVWLSIDDGSALRTIREEHTAAEREHDVWGVPTIIVGRRAAFIRLMEGPGTDTETARITVERLVAMVADWPELNELKHTSVER